MHFFHIDPRQALSGGKTGFQEGKLQRKVERKRKFLCIDPRTYGTHMEKGNKPYESFPSIIAGCAKKEMK